MDAAVQQQLEVLENNSYAPSQERDLLAAYLPQIVAADPGLTLPERVFRDDRAYYGGLSRSDLAYDVNEVAFVYAEIETEDDGAFTVHYVRFLEIDEVFSVLHLHFMGLECTNIDEIE